MNFPVAFLSRRLTSDIGVDVDYEVEQIAVLGKGDFSYSKWVSDKYPFDVRIAKRKEKRPLPSRYTLSVQNTNDEEKKKGLYSWLQECLQKTAVGSIIERTPDLLPEWSVRTLEDATHAIQKQARLAGSQQRLTLLVNVVVTSRCEITFSLGSQNWWHRRTRRC